MSISIFSKIRVPLAPNAPNLYQSLGIENLIALLTSQCVQMLLAPRIFPVRNFMLGIFARKAEYRTSTYNPQYKSILIINR